MFFKRLAPRSVQARYLLIGALSFTIGSATVVQAAGPVTAIFRLADGIDAEKLAAVDSSGNVQVEVNNLPATQPVTGTVNVGNLPVTQPVSGTVAVSNFPTQQQLVATHVTRVKMVAAPNTTSGEESFPAINVSFLNLVMHSAGCTFSLHPPTVTFGLEFDPRGADLRVEFPVRLAVNRVRWFNWNVIGDCDMTLYLVHD